MNFRSIPLLSFYHFLRSALPKTCFRTVTTPVLDQTGNNLKTPMPPHVEKVRIIQDYQNYTIIAL